MSKLGLSATVESITSLKAQVAIKKQKNFYNTVSVGLIVPGTPFLTYGIIGTIAGLGVLYNNVYNRCGSLMDFSWTYFSVSGGVSLILL